MRKGNTEQRLGIVVDLAQNIAVLLEKLGCSLGTGDLQVHSPIDGSRIGAVATANAGDIDAAAAQSQIAFLQWRSVPAPRRGELVRLFGNALRAPSVAALSIDPPSAPPSSTRRHEFLPLFID